MTIEEWHEALTRGLDAAKFDRGTADPRVAWEVFRRLLAEPWRPDGGAHIHCRVSEDYRGRPEAFLLYFGRLWAVDEGDFRMCVVEISHVPEDDDEWPRLRALSCSVSQS